MLTVHVGLHKTGSTSVQAAVRRTLKSRAIVPQEGDRQDDEGVFQRLTRAASGVQVVSDENLLGSPFDGYAQAPHRARVLAQAFSHTPYVLVIYLRPQLEWVESVFIQHVQGGGTESPEHLVSQVLGSPFVHWSRLLEVLHAESGAERVLGRAFLPDRDVVDDFFSVSNINPSRSLRSPRINPSLAPSQVPLMRAVNQAESVTRAQRQEIRSVLQNMVPAPNDDFSPLPESLQRAVLDEFSFDWLSLADARGSAEDAEAFIAASMAGRRVRPYAGAGIDEPIGRNELGRVLSELTTYRSLGARSLRERVARRFNR